jgi:hypothetical protein
MPQKIGTRWLVELDLDDFPCGLGGRAPRGSGVGFAVAGGKQSICQVITNYVNSLFKEASYYKNTVVATIKKHEKQLRHCY